MTSIVAAYARQRLADMEELTRDLGRARPEGGTDRRPVPRRADRYLGKLMAVLGQRPIARSRPSAPGVRTVRDLRDAR